MHVAGSIDHRIVFGFRATIVPEPGHCWFDFDDSRVRPIATSVIEKQFAGRESAYMLFYRRKSLSRPRDGTCTSGRHRVPVFYRVLLHRKNCTLSFLPCVPVQQEKTQTVYCYFALRLLSLQESAVQSAC